MTRILLTCLLFPPLLGGCTLGPDFLRPSVSIPAQYQAAEGWKPAAPDDNHGAHPWWENYRDSRLNELVSRLDLNNQNIIQAVARYRQSETLFAASQAGLVPTWSSNLGTTRNREAGEIKPSHSTTRITLSTTWEVDLWGRLSRRTEAAQQTLAASGADLAAIRLSMQAALVQAYLQLRVNDAQQRLLERAIAAQRRSYLITFNRREAGITTTADLAQAEAQLKTTEAQAIDLGVQRAQLEHLIALLIGEIPGQYRIAPVDGVPALPALPLALPSALLERRPDIAAAERRVAAANARVGVAQAAFFPSLTLTASGGYQNDSLVKLMAWPHRFWSLGPAIALDLFDGGVRAAAKEEAVADYDGTVAAYRQSVLTAFQEVEDNLAAARILEQESAMQAQARRAANEFERLTDNQYRAGTVSFLNVATAQTASLAAERGSLELLARQLTASVALTKALGGSDWSIATGDRPPDVLPAQQ